MTGKDRIIGAVRRALLVSAPFLLISAAIWLFAVWGVESFVEGNVYYNLISMAPPSSDDADTTLVLDEAKKDALKNNNDGDAFTVSKDFPAIALGEQWATITIESAGVDAQPVLHGDNDENLWRGIGHYSNSRFPGQGGKVVLAGHVGIQNFFQRLETVVEGDTVVLDTIYGRYEYRVTSTVIFDENDQSLLLPDAVDSGDRLICYTCYPYHTTSVRTQRFAIICEKVSGKDWTKAGADTAETTTAAEEAK